MNNKGFIATSIMYSFFIVFTLLSLSILATYTHYRKLNVRLNDYIKDEIKDKIISDSEYDDVVIKNLLDDGDFELGDTWNKINSNKVNYVTNKYYSESHSMFFHDYQVNNNGVIRKTIPNPIIDDYGYYYLRAYLYKESSVGYDCLQLGLLNPSDERSLMYSMDNCDYIHNNNIVPEGSWYLVSAIFAIDKDKTDDIWNSSNLAVELLIEQDSSHINLSSKYYVDDVMLVDITDIYDNYYDYYDSNNNNYTVKKYLDSYLEYFSNDKVIKKCSNEGDVVECPN